MEITLDDLKRRLPDPDDFKATDEYYLTLAKYIGKLWESMDVFPEIGEEMRKNVVVNLVSYYQDVIADAGLWRAFVMMCRKLYRRPVPFYDEPEDYIDYELNLVDVQFIVWYSLESQLGFNGLVSPFDLDLLRFARQVYKLFDFLYEDAPEPENFKQLMELDIDDREQVRDIFRMSGWLFWKSYFLRPVSKHAYEPEVDEDEELTVDETLTDERRLRTTFEQPTGPLALLVDEWLRLIVGNRLPKEKRQPVQKEHKYYKALKEKGANRFLLRHETSDNWHYSKLHPNDMSLENRKECLRTLKKLGYQTGTGIMVGSPYQTLENIADDFVFMQEIKPEMIGIGPFLPHKDTPFANEKKGELELTLILISMLRLIFPLALIPATTALGTIKEGGRELGILHGSNVVMPNLSPMDVRKKYLLYNDKIATGTESAEGVESLKKNMQDIGYILTGMRGDFDINRRININ